MGYDDEGGLAVVVMDDVSVQQRGDEDGGQYLHWPQKICPFCHTLRLVITVTMTHARANAEAQLSLEVGRRKQRIREQQSTLIHSLSNNSHNTSWRSPKTPAPPESNTQSSSSRSTSRNLLSNSDFHNASAGASSGAFGGSGASAQLPWLDVSGSKGDGGGNRINNDDGRVRIMCLYSDTGGGHRASAEALKHATEELFGRNRVRFDIVDLWTMTAPWPLSLAPKSYSFMVQNPLVWRFNYTSFYPKEVHKPVLASVSTLIGSRFARVFREYSPHLVVSVHPLLNHAPVRVLDSMAKKSNTPRPPFVTVVTDLTSCHSTWFCTRVDRCFVPTEEVRNRALSYGLNNTQIVLHGLPIRPMFSGRVQNQKVLRSRLSIDMSAPTVLLVGGAEGMGKLEQTAVELGKQLPQSSQLVVVCGRNKRLKERLHLISYGCKAVIVGFVGNMHEWMGASDIIVTKAGPGTIAEALTRGLPIILNGRIPCQEEGNIPWVLRNGVGTYETEPGRIAHTASSWITSHKGTLRSMSARARELSLPRATYDIARDLESLARDFKHSQKTKITQKTRSLEHTQTALAR